MNNSLHFISISHKTASITQRELYQISDEEKNRFIESICNTFPDITGLLLLVTCNRTEIYFESITTSAIIIRDFFISFKASNLTEKDAQLFDYSNGTEDTVKHLLKVSSGLASSVLGDAEIIHQIKKAYHLSMSQHLQGSLLERAMQAVFKCHKRISNETHYRDGTTSLAYKSLKVVQNYFNQVSDSSKKILFIGAGEIVKQLFKYNSKFDFDNIYISNRTKEKALILAKKYHCKTYDWKLVASNELSDFDVVISAVSNCQNLIKSVPEESKNILLIDLAMPCNINKNLALNEKIAFHDLDSISAELEDAKERRVAAIDKVNKINAEEFFTYCKWLQCAPLRASLAKHKVVVDEKVKDYLEMESGEYDDQKVKIITNRVIKEIMKQSETLEPNEKLDVVVDEQFFY